MRAVVCHEGALAVRDVKEPQPGPGHLVLGVRYCGICGSDLHARLHCDHVADLAAHSGYTRLMRSGDEVVMGHEFCGEVLERGPGCTSSLRVGQTAVAMPMLRHGNEYDLVGLCARSGGAYAERVVTQDALTLPVPNGLAPELAAMTEPMAVGWHAVQRGGVTKRDVAIVIGCGPVGLAVICGLKARGVSHIVAADFAPARRALAQACGANTVIDPAQASPFANWREFGFIGEIEGGLAMLFEAREKLGRLGLPWWHAWRIAEFLGAGPKRPVIFECVGVPGVLQSLIEGAPMLSRIVIAGVCMQSDRIEPAMAINKELDLRFAFAYSPLEFRDTLQMMAQGKLNPRPMLTGTVGLDGVAAAFDALGSPERHAKVLVDPQNKGAVLF
jgi:threonine dehydrogenase-like Zn-dependent dehydrogenase